MYIFKYSMDDSQEKEWLSPTIVLHHYILKRSMWKPRVTGLHYHHGWLPAPRSLHVYFYYNILPVSWLLRGPGKCFFPGSNWFPGEPTSQQHVCESHTPIYGWWHVGMLWVTHTRYIPMDVWYSRTVSSHTPIYGGNHVGIPTYTRYSKLCNTSSTTIARSQ